MVSTCSLKRFVSCVGSLVPSVVADPVPFALHGISPVVSLHLSKMYSHGAVGEGSLLFYSVSRPTGHVVHLDAL